MMKMNLFLRYVYRLTAFVSVTFAINGFVNAQAIKLPPVSSENFVDAK